MERIGVLLANLGTPDSPKWGDVRRYLSQFLTDRRVIGLSWLARQLLMRGWVVPRRAKQSAALYRRIWTAEGSPLLVHSQKMATLLQEQLGEGYLVRLGMRYQNPSLAQALQGLQDCHQLVILPLFPQYASATTGSVHEQVMGLLRYWEVIPETRFVGGYATHPSYIEALAQRGEAMPLAEYDHILFSFHGLPESQVRQADRRGHCLSSPSCCTPTKAPHSCYRAQCYATSLALAERLQLSTDRYTICFQSRFGKEPWTQPYADQVIAQAAAKGHKTLLVFAPAFTADCLETIDEIGREYAHQFQALGGHKLTLVPSLNDHPLWVSALADLICTSFAVPQSGAHNWSCRRYNL